MDREQNERDSAWRSQISAVPSGPVDPAAALGLFMLFGIISAIFYIMPFLGMAANSIRAIWGTALESHTLWAPVIGFLLGASTARGTNFTLTPLIFVYLASAVIDCLFVSHAGVSWLPVAAIAVGHLAAFTVVANTANGTKPYAAALIALTGAGAAAYLLPPEAMRLVAGVCMTWAALGIGLTLFAHKFTPRRGAWSLWLPSAVAAYAMVMVVIPAAQAQAQQRRAGLPTAPAMHAAARPVPVRPPHR